ncbi:hypothetical protein V1504DRAFT_452300 [Lipomyces starkeyi]
MVVGQSDSSTFKFDFSGINWSKDDPVSIVNAYREALKRQEQQKKRRLLESQIVTNGNRELGSVESSATISPTIPSASGSNRDQDNISNGGSHMRNYIANGSHEIAHSRPPSHTDSQVSEKLRKRPATESPEERRGGIKSSLDALWNSRSVASRLSILRTGRRNIRKYAPPSYFAQLRRPGDKIAAVAAGAYVGDNDQNKSESSTASVTLPGRMPAQATSDCSSLFSNSTAGFSEVPASKSRPLYVDSITQTDTALHESVNDRKRRLDVSDITPERKKRPGFFSAEFEDSDEELKEIEVEEPLLKKRRLFARDGVTIASNPAFYRTRLVLDGPDLHISPRKSGAGESDIARRRLELEREEREQQQEEREERLKRERQEKEAELERQRKELEEERKRQEQKQKELEEKERQLKAELLKKEQQLAESSTHAPALAPAGDNGAKTGFALGASSVPSVPAQPSRLQTSADAINLGTPSFTFGLSTSTPSDKTASVAPYLPSFSVLSGSGTDSAAATATTTIGDSKADPGTSTSTTSSRFQFGVKSSADRSTSPFTPSSGLPFGSGSSAPASALTFTSSATSVPSIVASSQAVSSAPSTGFSAGVTSAPSAAPTFSLFSKLSGSTEVASTSASATGSTPALTFSFGKTSTPSSASTTSTSSGPSLPAFAIGANVAATSAPAPAFSQSVSSASTTQTTGAPSFSFGSSTTSSATPPFGGFPATSSSTSLIPGMSAPTTTLNSAQSFSFTAGSTNAANSAANLGSSGASAAAPTFGSTSAPSAPAQSSTSLFNFASSTANPAAVFGFNASTEASPAPVAANGMTSSTPNMFASPAPSGTPPPGRKLAPMRGRLRRR